MPVVLLAVGLILLLEVFVSYGMSQLGKSFSTGFLGWFESQIVSTLVGGKWIANQIVKLTSWLTHELGAHFSEGFTHAVQFIAGLNQYVRLVASIALHWPTELFRVQQWLVWHEIPKLLKALPNAVSTVVHDVVKVVKVIEVKVVHLPKLARSVVNAALVALIPFNLGQLWSALAWVLHHFKALVHAVEHVATDVVHPGRLWHDVTVPFGRTIAQIKKHLRTLAWIGAFTSAGALVSAAFVKMGLGWVRCSNVAKAGKAICRANVKWLENLLLGTLAIFGTISLRTFAVLVYELTDDAARQTQKFWRSEVSGFAPNPGLGEIGGPDVALRPKGYKSPNPGLGDVA